MRIKSSLAHLAHLSAAVIVGICISHYQDWTAQGIAIFGLFTVALYMADWYYNLRPYELGYSDNPIGDEVARELNINIDQLDK